MTFPQSFDALRAVCLFVVRFEYDMRLVVLAFRNQLSDRRGTYARSMAVGHIRVKNCADLHDRRGRFDKPGNTALRKIERVGWRGGLIVTRWRDQSLVPSRSL